MASAYTYGQRRCVGMTAFVILVVLTLLCSGFVMVAGSVSGEGRTTDNSATVTDTTTSTTVVDLSPGSWQLASPFANSVYLNQNYGISTYDTSGRGEIHLAANVWDCLKIGEVDNPHSSQISLTAALTANTRHSMLYGATSPFSDNLELFAPDHIPSNVAPLLWDDAYHPIAFASSIGGWFNYFGCWYTQMYVTTDGLIVLDLYADMFTICKMTPGDIGSTAEPNAIIAPMWRDMKLDSTSKVLYGEPRNKGSAPGLEDVYFAVVWQDVICESDNQRNTFGVLFHSTFGRDSPRGYYVSFVYKTLTSMSNTNIKKSIGIEDQTGKMSTGISPTTLSNSKRIDLKPSSNNFYTIKMVEIYAEKLNSAGQNDNQAELRMRGLVEDSPGGMNLRQMEDVSGAYEAFPTILRGGGLALQLASKALAMSCLGPYGLVLAGAAFAIDLACYLWPTEPSEVLNAGTMDPEAYYKAATVQDWCPNDDIMEYAWDVSLFPWIEWEILDPYFVNPHYLRLYSIITIGEYDGGSYYTVTSDAVTLAALPSGDVPSGFLWLPRTSVDNGGCSFNHINPTIDGVVYDGYHLEANYEPDSGYDMMGWAKLTKELSEDYRTRADGSVRVEGYFQQQDTTVTQAGRSVKAYLLTQDLNYIPWSENILTAADEMNKWIFKSVSVGKDVFSPQVGVKVGIGRPNNWANQKFAADWAGTQIYARHWDATTSRYVDSWTLQVSATPGGTTYFRSPDGTVDLTKNYPRDYSWVYPVGVDTAYVTYVYAEPDPGCALDYWVKDGITIPATGNNPLSVEWASGNYGDHSVRAYFKIPAPDADFRVSMNLMVASVDGSYSTDSDGTVVSWSWNWGDGSPHSSGVTATHEYAITGTYLITLTATDDDGFTDTCTKEAEATDVPNQNPVAAWTCTVNGLTVYFNGLSSYDPDGTIVSYVWNFGDATGGLGATQSHTYNSEGSYLVRLTVTDNDGGIGGSQRYIVLGEPPDGPTAEWTYTADYLTVHFDASDSYGNGGIVAYSWDFGDGSTVTTPLATKDHTYAIARSYLVTLTVRDDLMLADSLSKQITVYAPPNEPPVAAWTYLTDHLTVEFDASGSVDPDGSISEYSWLFGDGASATGVTASHTYDSPGTKAVTLTVTDDDGATDDDAKTIVLVANSPPVAAWTYLADHLAVDFDASSSVDSDGTVTSYVWQFGDGAMGTGVTPTHVYEAVGTKTVTLTVYDDDGASDTETKFLVIVANQPPVAAYTYTTYFLTASFDASTSSDVDGTIGLYFWEFGDGTIGTGMTISHTYTASGTYNVALTVQDDDEVKDVETRPVSVAADAPPTTPGIPTIVPGDELDGTYTLRWTASVDNDATPVAGYCLMESVNNGAWTYVNQNIPGTSYTLTRAPGSYLYCVCAFDSADPPLYSGWAAMNPYQPIIVPVPDSVPPVTTAALAGTVGSNGWYTSTVTVTLTASDSNGISATYYKIDTARKWTTYTGPFQITKDGKHAVYFYSVDALGFTETTKSVSVWIDQTDPITTASVKIAGGIATVTLKPTDSTSLVAKTYYSLDGGATWLVYTTKFQVTGIGAHTVYFYSVDNAGNQETIKSTTFTIK